MSNSVAGLFHEFFNNKMETFETAFPGRIVKVNQDGTVNVVPMVKNALKNMQYEPTGADGELNAIEGVPVLFGGTGCVLLEMEIAENDPVLCVACSRDIRSWIENGWNGGPYEPVSFSANSLNDLVAIPLRRVEHGDDTTSIHISRDGAVTVTTKKKVKIESDWIGLTGDLVVDGNIHSKKDIVADCEGNALSMSGHIHPTGVGPSSPASMSTPVPAPIPEPE